MSEARFIRDAVDEMIFAIRHLNGNPGIEAITLDESTFWRFFYELADPSMANPRALRFEYKGVTIRAKR